MKKLESKKFKLASIWLITSRAEKTLLPPGVNYIVGDERDEPYIIRLLEYEVLYNRALATGLPFDFKKILKDNGYNLVEIEWHIPPYIDCTSEEGYEDIEPEEVELLENTGTMFKKYIEDCGAYVDLDVLKRLRIITYWLDLIDESLRTNIHSYALYNPYMYNKKLEGMYGNVDITTAKRNLLIIDISNSMTKAISTTCLLLSKTKAETFHADILITGKISVLYPYEILYSLDVEKIYEEVGMSNEGDYFTKLLSEPREYGTAVVFGDNDHPGFYASKQISDADGKKLCKWKVDKIISLHKDSNTILAGYARWFNVPKENITYVSDWVKYLN